MTIREAKDKLRTALFPRRCVGCKKIGAADKETLLCPECREKWKKAVFSLCPDCGIMNTRCRCKPRQYGGHIRAYYHAVSYRSEPARKMLYRIKRRPDTDTVRFFAKQLALLAEAAVMESGLPREMFLITSAPRTRKKQNETGTDQAKALAEETAYLSGIPYAQTLRRVQGGTEQKTLSAEERLENTDHAFECIGGIQSEKAVLLIDDIITTGATLEACAAALLSAGASEVRCITVGKTYWKKE